MTKKDFNKAFAEKVKMTQVDAMPLVTAFFDTLEAAFIADEPVKIADFGTFEVVKKPEREGFNPHTMEKMTIQASKTVKFKPATALKAKLLV